MNFEEFGGISKSLFSLTAIMPNKKNNKAGLVKLSNSKFKFIVLFYLVARFNRSFIDLPKDLFGNFSAIMRSKFF